MSVAKRPIKLWEALLPILVLILLLATNVVVFGEDASYGSNQIALILAGGIAAFIGIRVGVKWDVMEKGIVDSISSSMQAILILLIIGALAGTWLVSGIIPAMIYYGVQILSPTFFLVSACIISAIISLATGSSWSTIATIGVALLGIGTALDIHIGLTAGAIISGAYFGDKMSPLSDTTNLAPAMAGTDLFTHIRHMAYTTVPSITITLIIFLIIGFFLESGTNAQNIETIVQVLGGKFNVTPALFIAPLIVGFLIYKKMPALPALLIGALVGGLFALIFQPHIVEEVAGVTNDFMRASYLTLMKAIGTGVQVTVSVGNKEMEDLLNGLLKAKGMEGMLNTIWLIITAMIFGGVMEATGFLHRLTESVIRAAQSTGSLIASTVGTCMFFNVTASDQFLAIVVPGRMYADTYRERGLAPENLSRTLEDAGTVTSVLVPWNTCGAAQASVLGVATLTYAPFCFFNIISPFMSVLFGYLGLKINELKDSEEEVKNGSSVIH